MTAAPDPADQADPIDRLATLFESLRKLPIEARDAAIDEACGDDAELAAELRSLLSHHDAVAGPLEEPLKLHVDRPVIDPGVARLPKVGPYRIVRQLGEGGMGVVYLAEQESPRRLVALKMLRPGLVGRSLMRRFAQESELLGRLQHPGIAAVHEAGTADLGFGMQPYFAMEFVEGVPLTDHADRVGLDRDSRLALIVQVAEALQHAHDRGIVHRDLKPANILVDATGRPRILDFGVARSVDADAQMTTLRTDVGQLVGTIPYMSPEQLDGRRGIDARSDVYALGVLTYELLTGRLPHDIGDRSVLDALATLRHDDPTTLAAVNSQFRGDLDVIVGKALERDADRRYPSAHAFAADLGRALRHEPIAARPPSVVYRSRKFVRRHRGLVLSTALVMLTLALAAVAATVLALEANARRVEASDLSERLARDVIVQRILAIAADLDTSGGRTARRMLDDLPVQAESRWEVRHLKAHIDGSSRHVPVGSTAGMRSVVTADGMFVVSERDGRIMTFEPPPDGSTARPVDDLPVELVAIRAALVDMVGANEEIVASFDDGTVIALRPRGGVELWRADIGVRAALRADVRCSTVAAITDRSELVILDLADGRELRRFAVDGAIEPLAFTHDGSGLIVSVRRAMAVELDLEHGQIRRELRGHPVRVSAATAAPDGTWIATGDAEGTVILRDGRSGELLRTYSVPHSASYIYSLVASADSATLVAGTGNGTVIAWDATGAAPNPRIVQLPEARVRSIDWHPSQSERIFASAVPAGIFEIDIASLDPVPTLSTLLRARPILDGHSAAISAGTGSFVMVCLRTGSIVRTVRISRSMLRAFDVGPDGRSFAALDGTGVLHLGVFGSGAIRTMPIGDDARSPAVAVLADGSVAVATNDGTIRVLDPVGEVRAQVSADAHRLGAIAADPAGTRFASGGDDGRLRIWSMDGEELTPPAVAGRDRDDPSSAVDGGISALAWIDASSIAVGRTDGALSVIEFAGDRARLRWRSPAHPGVVNAIAVTPDRTRLATVSTDRTVRLHDAATGDEVLILRDITAAMQGIVFSADGSTLMGTALDGSLRFWRTDPERIVARRRRLRAAIIDGHEPDPAADAEEVAAYRMQAELAGWPLPRHVDQTPVNDTAPTH